MKEKTVTLFERGIGPGEESLLLVRADREQTRRRDLAEKNIKQRLEAAAPPRWLHGLEAICLALGALAVLPLLEGRTSLERAWRNAPVLLAISVGSLLVALGLLLYRRLRMGALQRDPVFQQTVRELEQAEEELKKALGLPEDTESLEILAFAGGGRPAQNVELQAYARDGELFLYDGERVLALPLAAAKLRILEQGIPVDGSIWLRKDAPSSRKYRKYGVMCSSTGQIGLRFCGELEIWKDGRGYRLLFPAYEILKLALLTELAPPKLPGEDREKHSFSELGEKKPVRPVFYWAFPRRKAAYWATPQSDVSFQAAHPRLYVLLVLLGIFVLVLPAAAFVILAGLVLPGAMDNGWVFLGFGGGFVAGIGLFNLVAAWMHQYLGHWFTLGCLLLGGILMAVSWGILA